MKILQINTVYGHGSTGKIAQGLHDICIKNKITCVTAYRYHETETTCFSDTCTTSSWLDCHVHNRLAKCTLLQGFFSRFKTFLFLRKVKNYAPDIIHLHNLHGNYINLPLLFKYIKKYNIPTVWTLHDCWAFTGQCPHFTLEKCEKWKSGCYHCQHKQALIPCLDMTKVMWSFKKSAFTGIKDMSIVTPSKWLANLVKESYLKEYPLYVIHNGIDLDIFKPTQNNFRSKYNIGESKNILLGVAFGWGYRKGLDVFIELAKRLNNEQYQIVLVGTDDSVDTQLPNNIISIHRTNNQNELAEIYTSADLFVNPTREDNYPTVNMEAIACGTPVLTFKTGGSPEIVDESCGSVVDYDDVDSMENEIIRICTQKPYTLEACLNKALTFNITDKFKEYVNLYEQIKG